MYVTVIKAPTNTRGEQVDVDDWLASLYLGIPLVLETQINKHSQNFFETSTYVSSEGPIMDYFTHPDYTRHLNLLRACILIIDLVREVNPGPLEGMYETFHIPKSSGGTRRIDAPNETLKEGMASLLGIFDSDLKLLPHNNCFSYTRGRGVKDALMVHRAHESKWFAKFDMKDFFPSTNIVFLKTQLSKLYPFSKLGERHQDMIDKILEFCMYEGGLPQGTPMSPILTNLMMLPIDFLITNMMYRNGFRYTRYADDILISNRQEFDVEELSVMITSVLEQENAPFKLNPSKTRYGSIAGSNWNLGLMLNKDNHITIGYKRKQAIKATINNFFKDFTQEIIWSTIDVQRMIGELSFLRNIEPDYADFIVQRLQRKWNLNFRQTVKDALN